MPIRIYLVHASRHSIAPIEEAFRRDWPEAEAVSIFDDALYADVDEEGTMTPDMPERLLSLFTHCRLSGAQGIVFTGSTFGHAVEEVRSRLPIPILKPDEAMAEEAVEQAETIALLCTAQRALPVIKANFLEAAAHRDRTIRVETHWVPQAQALLAAGDAEAHHRKIAETIAALPQADLYVLGQLSMAPALDRIPPSHRHKVLTGSAAAVRKMRALCENLPARETALP